MRILPFNYRQYGILATAGLVALGASLTGCNKSAEATAETSQASSTAQAVSLADNPKKAPPPNPNLPTYQVAITSATPPFATMDKNGEIQGLDVDVIRRIGEIESFNVSFRKNDWNGMFNEIETGKSDIAISGISFTPERSQKYGLSKSYIQNPSAVIFQQGKVDFKSLDDLRGRTIAATDGGKSLTYAQSVKDGKVVTEKTPYLLLQKVVRGEAVGAIYDQPVLINLTQNHPEYKMTIIPLDKADDPSTQTVIVTSKNKPELLNKINDGLAKLEQKGELAKIKSQWGVS